MSTSAGPGTITTVRKALYILGFLDDADIEWMIAVGARRALTTGTTLIQQGQTADALSIVLEGVLTVEVNGEKLADLGAGEIVGEMSLVDADPPSATVRAARPTLVLCVSRAALTQRLNEEGAFGMRFYRALAAVLSGRLREANARLSHQATTHQDDDLNFGPKLDGNVLDTIHLAGARFDHMLKRLSES
jgi:CRP-like cAMP-binding protein